MGRGYHKVIYAVKPEPVLLDVQTQRDFFLPSGSYFTPQAGAAAGRIYRLFQWARDNRVPVISTLLRLRESDRPALAAARHCVEGTVGERKLARTILPRRINLGLLGTTDLPVNLLGRYQQVIFEMRQTDAFAHPRLERLFTELPRTAAFILCGAGLARGVFQAAIGLRTRGFPVIVASDAVADLGDPFTGMAVLRMEAKGCIFVPSAKIVAPLAPARPGGTRRPARPMRRATTVK